MPRKAKNPPSPFNSTSLIQWQGTDFLVEWARRSTEFSSAIAVLQNEQLSRGMTLPNNRADASMIQTGRMLGWSEAIHTLLALRQYPEKSEAQPSVTYGVDEDKVASLNNDNDVVSD